MDADEIRQETKRTLQELKLKNKIRTSLDYNTILKDVVKECPIYYDKNRIWWLWDEELKSWEIVDEVDLLNLVSEATDINNIGRNAKRSEIVTNLQMIGRRNKPIEPPINWIQFKNYVYDIETGEKFKPTSKYFFNNPIRWDLGETTETPTIDKLFNDWVGKENVKLLYEIIAYTLYRDYPLSRIFCLIGSGRNGKSTFLNLLKKFIGNNNTSSTSLDILLDRPFETFNLYKKLICMMGETNYSAIKKTDILKRLTGKDLIRFEKKGKDAFSDMNYAKIIIATNGIPITLDKSDGFYRRWLIVEFNNQFKKEEDIIKKIPINEFENLALKSVQYLKNILDNGSFTNELSIEDKQKLYEEKSNPISLFLKKHTEYDFEGFIYKFEMKERINHFLKENNFRLYNNKELNTILKDMGLEEGKKGSNGYWAWLGKKLLSSTTSRTSKTSNTFNLEPNIRNELESSGSSGSLGSSPLKHENDYLKKWNESDETRTTEQLEADGINEETIKKWKTTGEIYAAKPNIWSCL